MNKEEMQKALKCLYLAVQEDIAKDVETKVMNYVKHLEERCEGFATNLYRVRKERNDLKDRVKMLEDIIAKYTSIPKAVIPMLTTKFPEIVQSEITHFDPNSTEVKELIEKCKPFLDYNTNNEILTLHQNNIE
jgi:hypothetical protein